MNKNKLQKNYLKVSSYSDYVKLLWNKNKFKINEETAKRIGKPVEQSPLDLKKGIKPWLTAFLSK